MATALQAGATVPAQALPPGVVAGGEIGSYVAGDGRVLRFQVVTATRPRHHLLYLHGIESHGGWFLPAALRLGEHGCTTWLLDRRGSGLNGDLEPGDTPSAEVLLDDVRRMRGQIGDAPLHLVGLSWGGKLAVAAALEHIDSVQSLTLITPGLRTRVDLSLVQKAALVLDLVCGGRRRFALPIRPEMFTTTAALLDFIRRDPWRLTKVTARLLWASRTLDRTIRRHVARLRLPVLLFLAGRDQIIDNDGVLRLLSTLASGQVTARRFETATHAIQLERVAAMTDDIVRFVGEHAGPC